MSELFFGSVVGVVVTALAEVFRQAGVPVEPKLLKSAKGLSLQSLLTDWHSRVKQELETSSSSLRTLPELEPLARVKALDAVLMRLPLLGHMVQHTNGSLLSQARATLGSAERAWQRGDLSTARRCSIEARGKLEEAVHNTFDRFNTAQQSVAGQALIESLTEMGYRVERHQDNRGIALWAVKGGVGIATVLARDGSLTMDMWGFEGLACQAERTRLLTNLAEKGISIRQRGSILHGRKSGGQVLQKAHRLVRQQGLSVPRALLEAALPGRGEEEDLIRRQRQALVWGQHIRL